MAGNLDDLREAFDRIFASPPPEPASASVGLLALRAGGDRFALRLEELSGLVARRRVVPLPGGAPGLLGIAGLRGRLVPVFDLAGLLGYPATEASWRWLALCRGGERDAPVGLAVSELEAFLHATSAQMHAGAARGAQRVHVREVFRADAEGGRAYGVISIPSILHHIRGRADLPGPAQE